MDSHSTLDALTGPATCALVSSVLLAAVRLSRRRDHAAERAVLDLWSRPTDAIDSAVEGAPVKVIGVVVAEETRAAPLTGLACVVCEVVAEVDVADGARRDILHSERCAFWIESPTGARLRVEPDDARVIATPSLVLDDPGRSASSDREAPRATAQRDWVLAHRRDERTPRRVEERRIAPGETVIAVGTPRREADRLVLRGGADALTLAAGTEREFRAHLDSELLTQQRLSWLGAAGLATSLLWGLWTLAR